MKAFLAGKRGICPDCEAKFIVPAQSGEMAMPVNATAEQPNPESAPASAPPVSTSIEPPPIGPSDALPPTIDQSLPDTWYVRPISGEQYGPANTELIQSWAAEGRIAEDSWVWRTGWDNWKIAHEVFELQKSTPASEPDPQIDQLEIDQRAAEETFTSKPRKPRPNSRKERARRISVALGTLVLVLAGVLMLVLWYQS